MAIEIYDSAKIVKKNFVFYYFLKYGSKNCFTNAFQTIKDDNFRDIYIRGQRRDSDWSIIAYGSTAQWQADKIAETYWNSPTSSVYGQIRFGNKKNIALYFVKNKNKIMDYDLLDEIQKKNIDGLINYYNEPENKRYAIDLANIPEDKKMNTLIEYCGNKFQMSSQEPANYQVYNGMTYWALDNL